LGRPNLGAIPRLGIVKKSGCDKIGCDKNCCDVLVGKQLMRPAFGLPDGRCVIPFPQPLTQAIPTKEACHV